MGLDIVYYNYIKEVEQSYEKSSEEDEYHHFLFNYNGCFSYQLGSLKPNQYYNITDETESESFRAGSYSGFMTYENI